MIFFIKYHLFKNVFFRKVLKEILPIYSRYMTMHISELPTDVLMNIQAYLLGKPEDLKFKHNRKFVEIQRLFKIIYKPFRFLCGERFGKRYINYYYNIKMSRLNLNILMKQTERLYTMWQKTYNRFIQSEFCPYNKIFISKIEIDIEGYSNEGLYVYLCSDELYITSNFDCFDNLDAFLIDTKMEFENEMLEKNVNIKENIVITARIRLEY